MRFTRRLLDRRAAALTFVTSSAVAIFSCSAEREVPLDVTGDDASVEASPPRDGEPPDSGPFDARLRPIECESSTCAVALVSSQDESFCALLRDGSVVCWGANASGQLGRGEVSIGSATPERVAGLSNIVSLDRTCAIDGAGAAWCWGRGPFHGDAGGAAEPTPVKLDLPPVKKVSTSETTGCALVESGVLCWGANVSGQIASDGPFTTGALPPTRVAMASGAPIRDLAINETSFIVREDGISESWGANLLLARASSLFPDPNPLPTLLGRTSEIDVAEGRACAAVDGAALCWGDDVGPIPQRIVPPQPIVQISTTKSVRDAYEVQKILQPARWCAVAVTGGVYCFGNNSAGQAGDGTKNHAVRPVAISGLPGPAARVKTTYGATCALLTTGKIYCVGSNYYGQLGDGAMRRSSLEPVEVILP